MISACLVPPAPEGRDTMAEMRSPDAN